MRYLIASSILLCSSAIAQDSDSNELPSILKDLSATELALMDEGEKQSTQGQGLRGLDKLLLSRQLRSLLLQHPTRATQPTALHRSPTR